MRRTFFFSDVVQISVDNKRTLVAVRHAEMHYHVHYVLKDKSLARLRTKVLQVSKAEALLALERPFDDVVPVVSAETSKEKRVREADSERILSSLEDAVSLARAVSASY